MNVERDKLSLRQKPSPFRLRLVISAMAKIAAGKIMVKGKENLNQIPPKSRVILTTTHLTDFDLPLAFYILANDFDIAITHISAHKKFSQYPFAYLWEELGGRKNFIPIDFKKENGQWVPASFNPENFRKMREFLEKGKAIMISAHSPALSSQQLPQKPGIGASYLAQITPNSFIVPISVDIKSNSNKVGMAGIINTISTITHRPNVTITIGIPIKTKPSLNPKKPIDDQKYQLQEEQSKVMRELAKYLPLKKAGIWATT